MATSCPHISVALGEEASNSDVGKKFMSVISWNTYRSQPTRPAKRRKVSTFFSHMQCVDAKTGSLFCKECDDFVYDSSIESLHLSAMVSAQEKRTKYQSSKHPREAYKPWTPSAKELEALGNAEKIPCHGRRGLLNLGQTCYMNVVLQCFIHNPLLRNYFLSDKHNCKQCKVENCTCCEMDKLFTEIYSDDPVPYGPISFLATTWKASAEISGYAQQDAHEFFMANLNHIHSTSRGCTNVSCNCIIHSTFSGSLQSDVTCDRCGNVTTTIDPVLDISLELKGKAGEASSGDTLGACLRRHVHSEKLGREYSCAKCVKASPEATKRFSIQKLPPVLAFQFKVGLLFIQSTVSDDFIFTASNTQRFEHKTNDRSSARKIDTPIRFPASINMEPYTTHFLKEAGKENIGSLSSIPGRETMCEYDLFAVINHEGQINNGHYTNFARCKDEWYRFDDDKVTPSSLGACLNSNAYMCFYVKRHLDYKPNMTPTYVLTRETEALREKELEKEKAARMREVEDDLLSML
ncbi:Ubiquitin carboxyl-terminal hydrolase 22 [Psilocybe cubensis]|uniref:Ubiquitin carboxyl-terminal hydrolase 22 n=1 Tax=Psilocybe cubensis TaxID=181762 RepID=A0ACB8H1J6_PSICU|nr:Ubiquitin carboxyl-terminal hydrolase 22 [Psilocybe cubensis]KAH9481878.1 Ubiquitin carboxyl-terminal hydrolase 22 [Psilocybe cubensis]